MNRQFGRTHMSMIGKLLLRLTRFAYQCVDHVQHMPLMWAKESNEDPSTMGLLGAFSLGSKYFDINYFDTFDTLGLCKKLKVGGSISGDCIIHIAGDLMPYKSLSQVNKISHLRDFIAKDFFNADIVTANLETPIHLSKKVRSAPEVMLSDIYFNASEQLLKVFCGGSSYIGRYDVLSLANNHMLDQGVDGILSTKNFLAKNNISTTGFSANSEDPTTSIIECSGVKIGFASRTYSLNKEVVVDDFKGKVNLLDLNTVGCDYTKIYEEISMLKSQGVDYIILSLHMGHAYQGSPSVSTIENINKIFDVCGPDMITITHPHTLQPIGNYDFNDPFTGNKKQGIIYYSLGNFIADDIYVPTRLAGYIKLGISKDNNNNIKVDHKLALTYMYKTKDEELVILPLSNMSIVDRSLVQEWEQSYEYPMIKNICAILCDYSI